MNKQQIIQKLNSEFSAKRQKANYIAEQNYNIALQNEKFKQLTTKKATLEFSIAKLSVDQGDRASLEKLENELALLDKEIKVLLKQLKLKQADFEPKYSCKKCNDSGRADDKYCACFKNRMIEELVLASGLEKSELNTFDNFDEMIAIDKTQQESLKKLKVLLLNFSEKFPASKYCNVIISGKTGVGKTFALECTASEIMKKGYTACFISAFQLNNQFLKYHTCFDANKQSYLDLLLDPDLLVIDDLGTEPLLKNVTIEYLNMIISERMLKHKFTMISTNHNLLELQNKYGERIFSRLANKTKSILISLEGDDLRINNNK